MSAVRLVTAIQILFALSVCWASEGAVSLEDIPFQFRDGLIWVDVTVTGATKPLHFLFDSGAQVSVINMATAQRLGVKRGRPVTVVGVGAKTTGYWPQTVDARVGPVPLPRKYLMLDLSKLGQACTNGAVDGIIGADFVHDRIVQIDFRRQALRLLSESPAEIGTQVLPLKVRPCGMLVPIRINESKLQWVRLDTGCASALQWVTGSVEPAECTKRVAVALSSFSVPVAQTTVKFGTFTFKGVPTDLQAKEIFPGEKGLLGNGLLSRFQMVTIDARGKKLILTPASHPRSQGGH